MEIQIVTGFLGAGKTTFLNRYLPLLSGKTVVIENEFGDIGIDGIEYRKTFQCVKSLQDVSAAAWPWISGRGSRRLPRISIRTEFS